MSEYLKLLKESEEKKKEELKNILEEPKISKPKKLAKSKPKILEKEQKEIQDWQSILDIGFFRFLAKTMGVPKYSNMTKQQLIKAVEKAKAIIEKNWD